MAARNPTEIERRAAERLAQIDKQLAEARRQDDLHRERELCRSLSAFVRLAWEHLEPGTTYIHGPHIDFLCDHLEAVTAGQIRRLLINIPPGTMKSTICGVLWPMWEWTQKPTLRFLGVSHEVGLGIRDNRKCRTIAQSEWYQALWGDKVTLTLDQNAKLNFENTVTGSRQVATPSNITGRRGDRVICDDLLSVENANSDIERESVNRWYRESLPTRLNSPMESAIVCVMQRLHENDVAGQILASDWGYEHVNLPMRFDPSRRCITSIGQDWRTKDGELLFPQRFPEEAVARDEKTMGSYATAGQFQQAPVPRDGGLFKRQWFAGQIIDGSLLPAGFVAYCRGWDFAASVAKAGSDPDYSVGALMGRRGTEYFVSHIDRFQETAANVQQRVRYRAETDPRGTIVRIPQDPGQAGKGQAHSYVTALAGYAVKPTPTSGRGDKTMRALPLAIQAENGHLWFVNSGPIANGIDPWIETAIEELCTFPAARHDDQVDALADAFDELALGSGHIEFEYMSSGPRLTVTLGGRDVGTLDDDGLDVSGLTFSRRLAY